MSHDSRDMDLKDEVVKKLVNLKTDKPTDTHAKKIDKPKPVRRQQRRFLQRFPQAIAALIKGEFWEREKKGRSKVSYMSDFTTSKEKQKIRNRKRNKTARESRRRNR